MGSKRGPARQLAPGALVGFLLLLAAMSVAADPRGSQSLTPGLDVDSATLHARLVHATAWVRAGTQGVGTGWIVDAERRWLVTNLHVVGDQERIEAFFVAKKDGQPITERSWYLENQKMLHERGRAVRGKVVRRRDASDLALVELESVPDGIKALPLADACPKPGERVHSVGHRQDAEALWNHCTGEIRQVGKLTDGYFWRGKQLADGAPCLITQSPILPGDSGGALVNEKGEVVGVLAGLRQAPLAAIAVQAGQVRELLARGESKESKSDKSKSSLYQALLSATVWVRPNATEGRAAGWIVNKQHRLVLTTNSAAGSSDLVDVQFPRFEKTELIAEVTAYADRIGLRQDGLLVRGLVLQRDPRRDLALIELESLPASAAELALAAKLPGPGAQVHAISHPSGVELLWLYAAGSIRQLAQLELVPAPMAESLKSLTLLLQLPQQVGSSGGPVVNDHGQVVGLLAAKEGVQQQLGYALTAPEIRSFLDTARPLSAPGTPVQLRQRAQLLLSRGFYDQGIAALKTASEGDPSDPALVRDLIEGLLAAGRVKLAQEQVSRLQTMDGDSLKSSVLIARAWALAGRSKEADARCRAVLKLDEKLAPVYAVLASLKTGQEALASADEAIFLDPRLVEGYRWRAAAHAGLGDEDRAIADLSRVVELDPYDAGAVRTRAELYLRKHEPKRAIADFERLVDLLPRDAQAYRGLAKAWLDRGDESKAIPALAAALRWEPALFKSIAADVLGYGDDTRRRWPDDPGKRTDWFVQALTALRPVMTNEKARRQVEDALRSRTPEMDAKTWGDALEKCIRNLLE